MRIVCVNPPSFIKGVLKVVMKLFGKKGSATISD